MFVHYTYHLIESLFMVVTSCVCACVVYSHLSLYLGTRLVPSDR